MFQDYREVKPSKAGLCRWRVPHLTLDGVTIVFLAEFRIRGAGLGMVVSPKFDHWDGWQVQLPNVKIEWESCNSEPPKHGEEIVDIIGIELRPMPTLRRDSVVEVQGRLCFLWRPDKINGLVYRMLFLDVKAHAFQKPDHIERATKRGA